MAAKSIEYDGETMIALANHAHGLIAEFAALPAAERNRAAEVLGQLQAVINEFRRRRPAPTFRVATRRSRLDSIQSIGVEVDLALPVREFKGHLFEQTENLGIFRCERCSMVASRDGQDAWRLSGDSFHIMVSTSDIIEESSITPPCARCSDDS